MTPSNCERTSIVIPATNQGASIARLVDSLRNGASWLEILVVDDGSSDDTEQKAVGAGARVIRHPYRKGNGAAIKSGIRQAAGLFVLIVDTGGPHRAEDAARLVARLDEYELVIGARSPAFQAGWRRRAGHAALNGLASYLTGRSIPDLTSGFRAARRDALVEFLYLLPNGSSTSTTTTLAFLKAGYSVWFEPIEAVQALESSPLSFDPNAVRFFPTLLKVITIFSPLKIFLPVGVASFMAGAGYAVWTVATQSHVTNSSVLLILLSVVIFLMGLISEQIASLRFEGRKS